MCDYDKPICISLVSFMLVGCIFIGWAVGVTYMRYQAVHFKVATWQADESGRPNFVWKNLENK